MENNPKKGFTEIFRACLFSYKRSIGAFCFLEYKHWIITLVSATIFVCSAVVPLTLAAIYAQYGHHLSQQSNLQITIFMKQSSSASQTKTVARMIQAVTKIKHIEISSPAMAAREFGASLGLPVEVASQLNLPHSILISFPTTTEPDVIRALIGHLEGDSRVFEVISNLKSSLRLRTLDRNILLYVFLGITLLSLGSFTMSFYLTNLYSRSYLSEIAALRLLGASSGDLSRPLIFCGLLNAMLFSSASCGATLILTNEISLSIDGLLIFPDYETKESTKLVLESLIYCSISFTSVMFGAIFASKHTLRTIELA